MIRVSHLTKRYGAHVAVDDVSFEVACGEVVGFLGPNGAGKSTTLRILAGFLGATSGRIAVAGVDVADDSFETRRCVGYMPETVPLYPEMRVIEYLRFRAELKRVTRRSRAGNVDEAMRKAGVTDVAHKRIAHLSRGYRQRVGLADAIVAKPPVLVLDEPTAGLDPNQMRDARALVRELGRDHAVVLSTHILSEVEACATRVLLLHRGRLVAQGPTASIRRLRSPTATTFTVRGSTDAATEALLRVAPTARLDVLASAGDVATIAATFAEPLEDEDRARFVERGVALLVERGLCVRDVRTAESSLEEVFAKLTLDEPRPASTTEGGG
ncbi:MAG: ABC transporter ATP-binding protein [Myxococcota bacterium]|nr:ABC transporter ATP-binding protein [Myxococcota bacterium]